MDQQQLAQLHTNFNAEWRDKGAVWDYGLIHHRVPGKKVFVRVKDSESDAAGPIVIETERGHRGIIFFKVVASAVPWISAMADVCIPLFWLDEEPDDKVLKASYDSEVEQDYVIRVVVAIWLTMGAWWRAQQQNFKQRDRSGQPVRGSQFGGVQRDGGHGRRDDRSHGRTERRDDARPRQGKASGKGSKSTATKTEQPPAPKVPAVEQAPVGVPTVPASPSPPKPAKKARHGRSLGHGLEALATLHVGAEEDSDEVDDDGGHFDLSKPNPHDASRSVH